MTVMAFIESPLQAMNLCEYAAAFKIEIDILVINSQSDVSPKNRDQIEKVMSLMTPAKKTLEFDECFSLRHPLKAWSAVRSAIAAMPGENTVRLISGEYRSVFFWSLAKRIGSRVNEITILDDGSATLRINRFKERQNPIKAAYERAIGLRSTSFGKLTFFSVYALSENILAQDQLIKNTYYHLGKALADFADGDDRFYIIGSPLYEAGVIESFTKDIDITRAMISYFKSRYPNTQLVYIPHRRESSAKLDLISKEVQVERCDFPFEIYPLVKERRVALVGGFYSSLFDNLSEIYKDKINILSAPVDEALIAENWRVFVRSIYDNYRKYRPAIQLLPKEIFEIKMHTDI